MEKKVQLVHEQSEVLKRQMTQLQTLEPLDGEDKSNLVIKIESIQDSVNLIQEAVTGQTQILNQKVEE